MFVAASGNLYIEKAHPAYSHVIDFLVSCCEPVSRTHHMEEYRLDSSSLSAASAEGTYTTDMVRNVLRYFRLDAQQQLPIDVERYGQLEKWAGSSEAEANPSSYRLLPFLVGENSEDDAVTAAAADSVTLRVKRERASDVTESATSATAGGGASKTEASSLPWCGVTEGTEHSLPRLTKVKLEDGECDDHERGVAGAGAPPDRKADAAGVQRAATTSPQTERRRVLPLGHGGGASQRRPLRSAGAASPPPPPPSSSLSSSGPFSVVTTEPLVSLAVVRPQSLQPLPPEVEATLQEEENASKMRIVLQPRIRRFHHSTGSAAAPGSSPNALLGQRQQQRQEEEDELFYFIVSRDRAQLERVVQQLQPFLEPMLLHGTPRWVLSDVDRGIEERQLRETGRPVVLRRLFASPTAASARKPGGTSSPLPQPSATRIVYKSQVKPGRLREAREALYKLFGIRADCFYDYLQDRTMHVERLSLAGHVRLRPYQVASLERFRRGSKAHQGVVVLPCGAGKTLTGIGAAATLQKRTIVMCINTMSVFQWKREFLRWTNLSEDEVTVCTAKEKQMPGKVFITTYSMLVAKRDTAVGRTARESEEILHAVRRDPWGLLLLDEVHTALAHHFQEVLNQIKYKCVLGLSATLLREDDKIGDLRHLVGPKLYEANWLDLTRAGFLARVECAEVQCPIPKSFVKAYTDALQVSQLGLAGDSDDQPVARRASPRRRRGGLSAAVHNVAACNPYKLWCTQALLAFHRNRSPPDKVIIFCDYLADVRYYAHQLHLPYMDQRTSEAERANLLQYFQFSDEVNAIILTRVGDVALDLPCASVIIQISGLGASRRQEAQRLGRILRPKPPSLDNTCSYFYTLVSQDTHEVRTSYERQSWLRDQGFAYRVLHSDLVLREFRRVGGVPCCIGPPRWWYQTADRDDPPTGPAATASGSGGGTSSSTRGKLSLRPSSPLPGPAAVEHAGSQWMPFSLTASQRMQDTFDRGRDGCELDAAALGADTPRPSSTIALGGTACGPQESWTVRFSSVDAPVTFGSVRIGEGPETAHNVRRITFGQFECPHDCLRDEQGPCLTYALARLHIGAPSKKSSGGSGEEAGDEELDSDADGDE